MSNHEISFNTDLSEPVRTRADFTYKISPVMISIVDTGLGSCSVTEDIEAIAQDRALAPKLNCNIQNHVPRWQGILARCTVGWQNDVLFRSGGNRRANSPQKTIGRKLIYSGTEPVASITGVPWGSASVGILARAFNY
jgi:hypothetical protein